MADANSDIDLPAGSFDIKKLDAALATAFGETDDQKRADAVAAAIEKQNRTGYDRSPAPAGYKYTARKTTFNKGEPNEVTISETVLVLDLPKGDVEEEPLELDKPVDEAPAPAAPAASAKPSPAAPAFPGA